MPTIHEFKEQAVTETPLLLLDCKLRSGQWEYWSTHKVSVEGHDYAARIAAHNVFDLRAFSEDGIDSAARVSVTLINTDSYFSQIERNTGWKGAQVTVRFLFYDLKNGAAASEIATVFRGTSNSPDSITEQHLRLTFNSRLNLQRVLLPAVRIQRRCPWSFPSTAAQRQEAMNGGERAQFSPFFRCGYSADQTNGEGNLTAGQPYTYCNYNRADCEQRGMFRQDSGGKATRRFGGVEYLPPSILVRGYGEKQAHVSSPVENEARYNDFVPLVYGTAWFQPPIVFARNDGNLTRLEVLLGMGEIQDVVKVIVNNIEIPAGRAGTNMTATGWYNVASRGNRTGAFNYDFTDAAGNPLGDPYGSMATLSVVVPNRINDGKSLPQIRVLLQGLKVSRFDNQGEYLGDSFTNNPAWVLLDVLRRSGWTVGEIDLASFAQTAQYCDEPINSTDAYGTPVQIPRYQSNLVVRRRRSAADVVRGIRNACGLYLTFGSQGLLELRAEAALAAQQPVKPAGSNATSQLNGGWPAYEFGDGTNGFSGILRRPNGEPSVRMWSRSTGDTPNRLSVEFQDEFNEYQQDSLSLVEIDDAETTGQETAASFAALGLPNFDQARRMLQLQLYKSVQGNCFIEFETSMRAVGLKAGDIITVTYLKEGLARQPFRIIKLAPGTNYRITAITAQWHADNWYQLIEGLHWESGKQGRFEPGLPRPLVGTVIDPDGIPQFGIEEEATEGADGAVALGLEVSFSEPTRPQMSKSGIPLLSLSPLINTSGGTLAGDQTWYYAISAVDDQGCESAISFVVRASLPSGSNTNSVTLRNLSFALETSTFNVYRGCNPQQLARIATGNTVATTYTDTGLAAGLTGPPDENFDHANFYWRLELLGEQAATVFSATTIGNSTLQMLPNEYARKVVRITKGKGAGQEKLVASNDATTLEVEGAWAVTPDATSRFVVAESSWNFGAASATSPASFAIPNREGATVHVSGRAANSSDKETPYELSPITAWRIGGAAGMALDADVPPEPTFGMTATGDGTIQLLSVAFSDLENTRSIIAGTLTLFYWNELNSPSGFALASGVAEQDAVIDLSPAGSAAVGDLVQIEREVLKVTGVQNGGLSYQVARGSHGTTAASHAAATKVYHLEKKVSIAPFSRDFFGSPASGSYAHTVVLPNARVAAAELVVTNLRGNSPAAEKNLTATADAGLRTLSGGQITLQVDGYLSIEDDATAPLVVDAYASIRDLFAVVNEAPTGAPIELRVRQDTTAICTLTIPVGEIISNVVDGFGLAPLVPGARVSLDILSVGQTADTTPGRDLTVTIRT